MGACAHMKCVFISNLVRKNVYILNMHRHHPFVWMHTVYISCQSRQGGREIVTRSWNSFHGFIFNQSTPMQFVIYALPTIIYVHFWEMCFNRVHTLKSTTIHKHIDQSKPCDQCWVYDDNWSNCHKKGGKGFPKPDEHSRAVARPEKAMLLYAFFSHEGAKALCKSSLDAFWIFICFAFCVYNLNLTKQD